VLYDRTSKDWTIVTGWMMGGWMDGRFKVMIRTLFFSVSNKCNAMHAFQLVQTDVKSALNVSL